MKRIVVSLVVAAAVVVVVALGAVNAGLFDVAASGQENALTRWVMRTTMEHSVRARAKEITVPSSSDSGLISIGFEHYDEMCVTCHSSPAGGRSEAGEGLNPPAPDLSASVRDWTPAELYWIISHGIKRTGMPAFAPTHEPNEVWAMVAFVERLSGMDSVQYAAMKISATERNEETGQSEHHHYEDDRSH